MREIGTLICWATLISNRGVWDRLEIRKDFDELYGEFGRLYEVNVDKRGNGNVKWKKEANYNK